MIHPYTIATITASGSNGSATGSGRTQEPVNGYLIGVVIAQGSTPAATTDLTFANADPAITLLTLANNNTSALVKYPRVLVQGTDGADLTAIYDAQPVCGYLTAAIAQGNNGQTLDVTFLIEEFP